MKIDPRFFTRPLAMHRLEIERLAATITAWSDYDDYVRPQPQYGLHKGVAILPVRGVLANDLPWWADGTEYSWIRQGFDAALEADDVRAIALDVNGPGGTVEGCFDLVDHIFAARGKKPIWAILSESAYSATYALASAADRILIPRTGGAGSIGVVAGHVDISQALDKAGVKVTFIQYGDRKTDGASEKPLSEDALACFRADVDEMGELFVATVARNRGLDAQAIRDMQAGTFMGAGAVAAGLCDEVAAPDAAFSALLKTLG